MGNHADYLRWARKGKVRDGRVDKEGRPLEGTLRGWLVFENGNGLLTTNEQPEETIAFDLEELMGDGDGNLIQFGEWNPTPWKVASHPGKSGNEESRR